jgi:hypothetical protein
MGIWSRILVFSILSLAITCGASKPATPLETLKTYTKAIKQKDTSTMKLLLSKATIKMHEEEARVQSESLDDIVKRDTLFDESQTTVEYRNEKVDGEKAALEVKTAGGFWQTVLFVREDGVWKIDKQGIVDQMIKDMDESNRKLDERINGTPTPAY